MSYGTGVATSAEQKQAREGTWEEEQRARQQEASARAQASTGDEAIDNAAYGFGQAQLEVDKNAAERAERGKSTYGGYLGGAEDATNRFQTMGTQGVNIDRSQENWSRGQQMTGLGLMRGAAFGNAPSQAELMGRNMLDQSMQAQMSAAASSRGGALASAAAQQNAANQGTIARAQGMNQLAALRADEMAKARAAYMAGSSGMRGQDAQAAFETAKMNEQKQQYYEQMAHSVQQGQLNANLGFASDATQNRAIARQENNDDWSKWAGTAAAVGGGIAMMFSDERTKRPYSYGGIQARAAGGPVEAGTPYLVGEQGPEIVVPNQGGTVVPNGGYDPARAAGALVGGDVARATTPGAGNAAGAAMSPALQFENLGREAAEPSKPKEMKGPDYGGAIKKIGEAGQHQFEERADGGQPAGVSEAYRKGQEMAERQMAAQAPGASSAMGGIGVGGIGGARDNIDELQQLSYSDDRTKLAAAFKQGAQYQSDAMQYMAGKADKPEPPEYLPNQRETSMRGLQTTSASKKDPNAKAPNYEPILYQVKKEDSKKATDEDGGERQTRKRYGPALGMDVETTKTASMKKSEPWDGKGPATYSFTPKGYPMPVMGEPGGYQRPLEASRPMPGVNLANSSEEHPAWAKLRERQEAPPPVVANATAPREFMYEGNAVPIPNNPRPAPEPYIYNDLARSDKEAKRGFGSAPENVKEDANRKMEGYAYSYKGQFTPPEQKSGELNYGPMAQNLEKNPITNTAVKKDESGMRMLDMGKLVKVQASAIANLQDQLDALKKRRYGR